MPAGGNLGRCPECEARVNRSVNGLRCPFCMEEVFGTDDGLGAE